MLLPHRDRSDEAMSDEARDGLPPRIEALLEDVFFREAHWHSAYEVAVQPLSGQPTRADIQRIAKEMGPLIPELLDMRAAVEPKAAELASRRASDDAVENLRWLAERAHRVRPADLRQADSTLHIAVAHTARSDRILDLVLEEQMRLHELLAYLSHSPKLRDQQGHSGLQHDRIVDTIALRDPAAAYQAMRNHIEATNAIIVELLDLDLDLEAVP